MSRQSVAMLAGVIAVATLLLGGCGSSEDELTRAEFIKQGDAICKEGAKEIASQYEEFAKSHLKNGGLPSKAQSYEMGEESYLPGVEKQLDALRDLNPPSADEGKVEAILAAKEDGIAAAKKDIKVLFVVSKSPFEKANSLSKAYGFKVCGTS